MRWLTFGLGLAILFAAANLVAIEPATDDPGFVPLFPRDGVPGGWRVSDWADVGRPAPEGARWIVRDGVLHGSTPRGTWLVSEATYGDFVLDFEFRIGPQGNSGVGLRFPEQGDPAYDGLEVQIVARAYYGDYEPGPHELTGSLYKAAAPTAAAFRPDEWNRYTITCAGPRVTVILNGQTIQDVNLDEQIGALERGQPLARRPRSGHIGFQELSRGGGHVEIRNARIRMLSPPADR